MMHQGCILEPAAGEVRRLLCQVLPATFIALRVKMCWGDDVYQVPRPSTFHKTLATYCKNLKKTLCMLTYSTAQN